MATQSDDDPGKKQMTQMNCLKQLIMGALVLSTVIFLLSWDGFFNLKIPEGIVLGGLAHRCNISNACTPFLIRSLLQRKRRAASAFTVTIGGFQKD